ncbi:hypothetical protein [Endozoicomonas lisbonensis]|uniref:Uncharacterized protein n=1 Tax=Endozoicomonas lisbonensis TaxID=3120522 RepID=A0ABV2SPB8_9GAMM
MIKSKNDVSELAAVDFAFGARILDAFREVDGGHGSWHFQQFMKRDGKDKVFRGEFLEPKEFVANLQAYMKQAESEGKRDYNQATLPAVYYYRDLSMASADPEAGNLVLRDTVYDLNLENATMLSMVRMNLTYKVVFIAPDKPTVERMAMAWYFKIANTKQGGHKFQVPYDVAGERMQMDCTIFDPQTFQATSVSLPKNEQRLFALECEYEVQAPVLYGESVTVPDSIRWQLSVDPCFDGCHVHG